MRQMFEEFLSDIEARLKGQANLVESARNELARSKLKVEHMQTQFNECTLGLLRLNERYQFVLDSARARGYDVEDKRKPELLETLDEFEG